MSMGSVAGYEFERLLGRGGMGAVYLARHPRLPRSVAVKVLDEQMFGDAEARGRFEREADLAARLDHPNIVTVYDRGVDGNRPWIAMQYVPGTDAAAGGALEPLRAVRIVSEVAEALDFAHSRGVLHRDIKPANVLLATTDPGRPERVLLADFGIARLHFDHNPLTRTGTFTATLAYASPEQLAGLALGPQCDQYSLACTLFVLLTGAPPFAATNPVAVIQSHMSADPPALTAHRPGLPAGLDHVLKRAMAKRPEERFGSCGEFAAAVQAAFEPAGAQTAMSSMARRTAATVVAPGRVAQPDRASAPHGFAPARNQPKRVESRGPKRKVWRQRAESVGIVLALAWIAALILLVVLT
ncbi:serine/threonine-protein kinase [Nocardia sp. GTS18]|uniref:serine/threonine-protein kinase n=1 Tax=Nocardia sp. GTS18 TaxID=1778064 RepID=UPI002107CB43|nr:serine/threonine-protein kinase [Nocardia sp. GTS18]